MDYQFFIKFNPNDRENYKSMLKKKSELIATNFTKKKHKIDISSEEIKKSSHLNLSEISNSNGEKIPNYTCNENPISSSANKLKSLLTTKYNFSKIDDLYISYKKVNFTKKTLHVLKSEDSTIYNRTFSLYMPMKRHYKNYTLDLDKIKSFIRDKQLVICNKDEDDSFLVCLDFNHLKESLYKLIKAKTKDYDLKILNERFHDISSDSMIFNYRKDVLYAKYISKRIWLKDTITININNRKFKGNENLDNQENKQQVSLFNNSNKMNLNTFRLHTTKSKTFDKPKFVDVLMELDKNIIIGKKKTSRNRLNEGEVKRKDSIEIFLANKKYEKNIKHEFFSPAGNQKQSKTVKSKMLNLNILKEEEQKSIEAKKIDLNKGQKGFVIETKHFTTEPFDKELIKQNIKAFRIGEQNNPLGNTNLQTPSLQTNVSSLELKIKEIKINSNELQDNMRNTFKNYAGNKKLKIASQTQSKFKSLRLIPILEHKFNNAWNKKNIKSTKMLKSRPTDASNRNRPLYGDSLDPSEQSALKTYNTLHAKNLLSISENGQGISASNNKNTYDQSENMKTFLHMFSNVSSKGFNQSNMKNFLTQNTLHFGEGSVLLKRYFIRENNHMEFLKFQEKISRYIEDLLLKHIKDGDIRHIFDDCLEYFIEFSNQNVPISQFQKEYLFYCYLSEMICKNIIDNYSDLNFKHFFASSIEVLSNSITFENYVEKEEFSIYLKIGNEIIDSTINDIKPLKDYIHSKSFTSFLFIDSFFFKNFILCRQIFFKVNLFIDLIVSCLNIDMRATIENYFEYKIIFDKFNIQINFRRKFIFLKKMLNLMNVTQRFYNEDIINLKKLFSIDKRYYSIIKDLQLTDLRLLSKDKMSIIEGIFENVYTYATS